ncbi:MAG: ABC transporter permease [Ignavibacteria bacterium]|jgi:ABC-type antimicrobial peptide transport system permease subunit
MFNLEDKIKKWKKRLRKNQSLEEGYIEELESHLRDLIEEKVNLGVSKEEAFNFAVKKIGKTEEIGNEYFKTDTTNKLNGRPTWQSPWWMPSLFWNYAKVALRNIKRYKGYSFINIFGLTIGLTCTILILLWVQDELSYDRFHENTDRIFRIIDYEKFTDGSDLVFSSNPPALAPYLLENYPDIENTVRVVSLNRKTVKYNDNYFNEDGLLFVDPSFFEIFTYKFLKGESRQTLTQPNEVILTKKTAEKYFGSQDPIGKVLTIENQFNYLVTGVIEDVPSNSHLQFGFIVPFQNLKDFGYNIEGWNNFYIKTYIMLNNKADTEIVSSKISGVIKKNVEKVFAELSLQPLTSIHLYSVRSINETGDIKYIYIFTTIALFILFTACINFMNLSTARSIKRAKEVGMRKVIGAVKKQIVFQFYGESFLTVFISLFASLFLVLLLLPYFNELSGKSLSINIEESYMFLVLLFIIAVFTGLVAGSYPAVFLSSFRPVEVFKGFSKSSAAGLLFRKVLVTFQFILTISLIAGVFVIGSQLKLIRNQKLGYNKENLLHIGLNRDSRQKVDLLKKEFKKISGIKSITAVSELPSYLGSSIAPDWEGKRTNASVLLQILNADFDYANTLQLKMSEGRFFSGEFSADSNTAVVVNETAVKAMGMDSPVGKKIEDMEIIGVVKDFHFGTLHSEIKPLCIFYDEEYNDLILRFEKGNLHETIAVLTNTWKKLLPATPFNYKFLDETIDALYKSDMRLEKIINSFTFLILFVACLGLFGLASYTVEQRTKEIGVRKVLGASVYEITFMLAKDFLYLVLIANIIAWPVSYYLLNKWLTDFAYKINITVWIFIASGLIALIVALIIVSYHAFKSALSNPVNALRTE